MPSRISAGWAFALPAIVAAALFTSGCAKRKPVTAATSGLRPGESKAQNDEASRSRPDTKNTANDSGEEGPDRPPRGNGNNGGSTRPPKVDPADRDPFDEGPSPPNEDSGDAPKTGRRALAKRVDDAINQLEVDPEQNAPKLVADVRALLDDKPEELTRADFQLAQESAQALLQSRRVTEAVTVLRLLGKAFDANPDEELAAGGRSLAMQGHMVELLDASRRLEAGDEAAAELLTKSAQSVLEGEKVELELLLALTSISVETRNGHPAISEELSGLVVTGVERILAAEKINPAVLQAIVSRIAQQAEFEGNIPLAGKVYDSVDVALAKLENAEAAAEIKSSVEDARKRVSLVGKPLAVGGVLADGAPLDWEAYKDKVVLVDFWATWCQPCLAELPNIRANYKKYHDQGFEVIGVNLDDDLPQVEEFFKARGELPWPTVYGPDDKSRGFNVPLAKECGVSIIPFLVLIGKDGKVLDIHIRGEKLGQRLAEIFGDSAAPPDESSPVDEVPPAGEVP